MATRSEHARCASSHLPFLTQMLSYRVQNTKSCPMAHSHRNRDYGHAYPLHDDDRHYGPILRKSGIASCNAAEGSTASVVKGDANSNERLFSYCQSASIAIILVSQHE